MSNLALANSVEIYEQTHKAIFKIFYANLCPDEEESEIKFTIQSIKEICNVLDALGVFVKYYCKYCTS